MHSSLPSASQQGGWRWSVLIRRLGTAELRFRIYSWILGLGSLALLLSVLIQRPQPFLTFLLLCFSGLSATAALWLWEGPAGFRALAEPLLKQPLWWDGAGWWLIVIGGLCNLALFAYFAWSLPTLPPTVPLHFNAAGQVDRVGTAADLFTIPLIGGIVWLINTGLGLVLYRKDPMLTYVLAGGSALTQLLLLVAALTVTLR